MREEGEWRIDYCEVVLSDWLMRAIEANEVVSISDDYFRLTSACAALWNAVCMRLPASIAVAKKSGISDWQNCRKKRGGLVVVGVKFTAENVTVEFSVSAYEFPDSKGSEYDENWLQVCMEYFTDGGKVVRSDPALLTWELVQIRDLIVGGSKSKRLDFMEPEIEIKIQDDIVILETRYGLRLDKTEDVNIFESNLSEDWIAESASEIDSMCAKFPVRGKRSFKV